MFLDATSKGALVDAHAVFSKASALVHGTQNDFFPLLIRGVSVQCAAGYMCKWNDVALPQRMSSFFGTLIVSFSTVERYQCTES